MTQNEKVSLIGGDGFGATQTPHTGATHAIPRLGLPPVYMTDGPMGPRQGPGTAMPAPIALAASFDPGQARKYGDLAGDEAKSKGNDLIFGPTVNLMRTPQGGRTFESYGEEPYLAGQTAVAWIRAAQARGVIADVKHYLANNQEGQGGALSTSVVGGRSTVDARISERVLREVYLPHFEAAVKQGGVGTVMCSYNRVNGTYACEHHHTLVDVLKRDWGFRGVVLSDYSASKDTVGNFNNGLDFIPNEGIGDHAYEPAAVKAALASGLVSQATLDDHVRRILRTLFSAGFFDRSGYRVSSAVPSAHDAVARSVEEHAITLLKNRSVLPLDRGIRRIAVIGPYANTFARGGGSADVTPRHLVTPLQGITRRAGRHVAVTYDDGSDPARAASVARQADVAIVVVGDVETEGQDKSCLGLNCLNDVHNSNNVLYVEGSSCVQQLVCPLNGTREDALVSAIAAVQRRTAVVLETGGPVLTPWRDEVDAVVEAWYPGQEGGDALARVLFGDVDPSGRLPVTFPSSAQQVPTAGGPDLYPGVAEEETYGEGTLVGYRWYDAHHLTPAYAFGSGLSYTTFAYKDLRVTRSHEPNEVAVVSATVTNTGTRPGTAVPQLYVSRPSSPGAPEPVRQLAGYVSLSLRPGESAQVRFPLNDRTFATWGSRGWQVAPACYAVAVGRSSRDLPLRGVIARGRACPGAALQLSTSGRFELPLAPMPTLQTPTAKPTVTTSRSSSEVLASTGPSAESPSVGLCAIGVALGVAGVMRRSDRCRQ